tara:strand:- start:21889 stop:22719 length:831 start_codon:yes stop_codon:yes gene_type:complete
MKKNNIYGVVTILGGFGNQLFQLCFANYLKDNGVNVTIDMRVLEKVLSEKNPVITKRPLILPLEYFDFNPVSTLQKNLINISKIPPMNKLTSSFSENSFELESIGKFNLFNGYWQSGKYLHNSKSFLTTSLSQDVKLKEALTTKISDGSVALHVRRTDYLPMKQELHNSFYKKAISIIQNEVPNFHYSVFTDDLKWVKENKIFTDAENIYSSKNILDDFYRMLLNQHFIVGNSTFSLMAAFLKEELDTKIIVADPWFRGQENKDFIKDNWIKIKNV